MGGTFLALAVGQLGGLALSLALLAVSGETVPALPPLVVAGLGGAIGLLGLACLYLALSRGTMGLVAPLVALIGAAIPAIVGIGRGESATPALLAGMAAALAAVVLISIPESRGGRPSLPTYHHSRLAEWALIVLAGTCFAGFFLAIDAAHEGGGGTWWPLVAVRVAGVIGIAVAFAVLVLRGRPPSVRVGRGALGLAALAALGDTGGNLFFILASGAGELAPAVVLSSLYPVATALLARAVLHERLGTLRLAGAGLAICGVALIGLGSLDV